MKNVLKCEMYNWKLFTLIAPSNIQQTQSHRLIKTNKHDYPSTIIFTGKLEEFNGAANFFIAEKQQKAILNFSLDSINVPDQ